VARVSQPIGAHQTVAPDSQHIHSSVDELYRLSSGFDAPAWRNLDQSKVLTADTYRGVTRYEASATPDGKRATFVRVPERGATIIVLTNDVSADARGLAQRLLDQVLAEGRR
jgi:hypothetical protein